MVTIKCILIVSDTSIFFSDVNYLSTVAPPAAAEWTSLLRPLRGREPEGMWNLLSIVREMFKRNDRNAVPLLEIITEECLACEQILIWWFNTKLALLSGISGYGGNDKMNLFSFTNDHRMLLRPIFRFLQIMNLFSNQRLFGRFLSSQYIYI